ncbi:MAG: hypothetical protein JKY56_02385 [Kofleriaceae bacterium]|nr:hypothetical protein [Kofleriaceae bacterium]
MLTKTAELNLQTSLNPEHRSTYQYSPDRTIKIAMVDGDHGKGYYHLVAEGGQLPVKNISELKS